MNEERKKERKRLELEKSLEASLIKLYSINVLMPQ